MTNVVIIGAGNVATHLYQSFTKCEQINVIQIFNRTRYRLDFVEGPTEKISNLAEVKEADLYLLAVKDEAIEKVVENLKIQRGIVAHTSGTQPISILSRFANFGVFYPLQTFSKNKAVNFQEIPLCLEANSEENLDSLKEIGALVTSKVFEVNSEQRKALHVSAVFVNNFSNHLFALAADFCKKEDLPFDILRPLIKETVNKLESLDPYSAQTGPALRNDQKTISAHMEMLDKDRKKIYSILTDSIQNLHGKKL